MARSGKPEVDASLIDPTLAQEVETLRKERQRLEIEIARKRALNHIYEWRKKAHEKQIPPLEWSRLLLTGGRGSGKTWAAARIFAEMIVEHDSGQWAIVAPTFGDAVGTCICHPTSGLIVALGGQVSGDGDLVETGPLIRHWTKTTGKLSLRNGSLVMCDGGDDGAFRCQGKDLRGAWVDELGLIQQWGATWDESLGGAVRQVPARIIATGTPKRNMPARTLIKRLIEDPDVVSRQLYTEDNYHNLAPNAMKEFMAAKGTSLARQELYGELLDFSEGALWSMEVIDRNRLAQLPEGVGLSRLTVAVDPAGTSDEDADETGIIVAGLGTDGHGYVLADKSLRAQPATSDGKGWGDVAVRAYKAWSADRVVGETNFGGDMVGFVIHTVDEGVPYKKVNGSRGKIVRAEPAAAAYERGLVHHVGDARNFWQLEDQMCSFIPGVKKDLGGKEIGRKARDHDDRMDALVWALTDLGIVGEGMTFEEVYADAPDVPLGEEPSEVEVSNPWDFYGTPEEAPDGEARPLNPRNPLTGMFMARK